MKARIIKTLFWLLAGAGITVIILRIIHGVGSVVALNDLLPWGLWKGGGVVALVPIGGAGFTLAAFVYIFHWRRYEYAARGAVLLGLMCYTSVAAGLSIDIGIWWRIVFPVFFWQFHSTLFEIAWCIMLYIGVLSMEFGHVVLERFHYPRLHRLLSKFAIVFVIAGIALSSLHQSSLGTLFLATPYRLHPLWHTDFLPLFFLLTSVGLGCLTISWVLLFVHWVYDAEQPMDPISGLARISAITMAVYLGLKFGEILFAGEGALLFTASWDVANFWTEVALSALVPVLLMMFKRFRESPTAMFWISTLAIVGVSLNRINVAGLATLSSTGSSYAPTLSEWAVTLGILSIAALVFLFLVERFNVFGRITPEVVRSAYEQEHVTLADWRTSFFNNPLADSRLYSAAFIFAAGLIILCIPGDALYGAVPVATPTENARVVEVQRISNGEGAETTYRFPVAQENKGSPDLADMLLIDGNRNDDYVLFDHKRHIHNMKQKGVGCTSCHHMNTPKNKGTGCYRCHSDMYLPRSIFDHADHVADLGGNKSCEGCHHDPSLPKVRKNTTPCETCHQEFKENESLVKRSQPPRVVAASYKKAMHKLCISCHKAEQKKGVKNEDFSRCANCHRDLPKVSTGMAKN